MKPTYNFHKSAAICGLGVALSTALPASSQAQSAPANAVKDGSATYHFYRGNTHAHTSYTQSHGEQVQSKDPARNGSPAEHHRRAKEAGYDFYVTTDHSQEVPFDPTSPTNPAWVATGQQALAATDADYVALRGYEHSENNGPDGRGHFNVINSPEYLDALEPGVGVQEFYTWLKTQPDTVVTFNHPSPESYNSFDFRDADVTNVITLMEVINKRNIHYPAFVAALDKGWKISPVAGIDNHGFTAITRRHSRTVVLATAKTRAGVIEAMKQRRTYATLDLNLQAHYTVNGKIMGSTLDNPSQFQFAIDASDPDIANETNKIAKIDIVTDKGVVVETYTPTAAHSVKWTPTIENTSSTYFFVRIWSAESDEPVAWLAPVWTGR